MAAGVYHLRAGTACEQAAPAPICLYAEKILPICRKSGSQFRINSNICAKITLRKIGKGEPMKPQQAVLRETKHIALGTAVLAALMLAVFAVIGRFSVNTLLAALYGCALAVANFFFLGMTVQKIAETANADDPDQVKLAKLRMRQSYTLRMLLGAGLLILALAVLKLDWIACFLPLLFPRVTIFAMNLRGRVRSVKGSDIK